MGSRQVWVGWKKFKSNNPEGRLFYFIAELVVDLKLEYDHATTDQWLLYRLFGCLSY
jgi:hypothetical protein